MLNIVLISFGYRELGPNIWAKPVANVLFIIRINEMLFECIFKANNSELNSKYVKNGLCIWSNYKLSGETKEDLLISLKYAEQHHSKIDIYTESNFEFITEKDYINLL